MRERGERWEVWDERGEKEVSYGGEGSGDDGSGGGDDDESGDDEGEQVKKVRKVRELGSGRDKLEMVMVDCRWCSIWWFGGLVTKRN